MENRGREFKKAVAIMVGTVIGAGIFGLPYAVSKVGWGLGMLYLFILGLLTLTVNLCYGEVVLRTQENCQMGGYARKYLGRFGSTLISASLILGIYGGLLAYTIGVGNFLYISLGEFIGGSALLYSLIFWFLASLVIFRGLKTIALVELTTMILLLFFATVLSGISLPFVDINNLLTFKTGELFFPFGVFLFALGGASAVPIMKEVLGERQQMKDFFKANVLGLLIPILIYGIFITLVLGVTGSETTEQAIGGLAKIMGPEILIIGSIFGIIVMTTSFLANGFVLREVYHKDYNLSVWMATILTCGVPLIIFLLGMRDFVTVIGIAGTILGAFQGVLLLMMYYRARKRGNRKPEYVFGLPVWVAGVICLVFLGGLLSQILLLF